MKQCGDHWAIPDLDFDKGRRKLVFHFEVIEKHLENPFRPEHLRGRARIYFVALPREDNRPEFFLARNEKSGDYFVTHSLSQRGFKRLRAERGAWHYPAEERGQPVPKRRHHHDGKIRSRPLGSRRGTDVGQGAARGGIACTSSQRRPCRARAGHRDGRACARRQADGF